MASLKKNLTNGKKEEAQKKLEELKKLAEKNEVTLFCYEKKKQLVIEEY